MRTVRERLALAVLLLATIVAVGTIGYILIEGWTPLESVWMTVISLTTVGFGEVHPLSSSGRVFTIFLILGGMGTLLYGLSSVTAFVVEGELTDILERRKLEKEVNKLSGHMIVCGLGNMGWHVAEEFIKTRTPLVVVEKNRAMIEARQSHRPFLFVEGDATLTETLVRANVAAARGLVACLGSDRDNLYLIMTAKELNPNMRIVARAIEDEAPPKLAKVGADAVVSSDFIGGLRMASEMIRPAVVSFLDVMLRDPDKTWRVEEAEVLPGSKLAGQTLRGSLIRETTGLLVVAIRKSGQPGYRFNPGGDVKIDGGDILIVCGHSDQVEGLRKLLSP